MSPRCRFLLEALGDGLQQAVAHGVTETVVDRLEAVEIEEDQRRPALAPRLLEGDLQPVLEQRPVGQVGQYVVVGLEVRGLAVLLVFGDVPGHGERAGERSASGSQAGDGQVGPHGGRLLRSRTRDLRVPPEPEFRPPHVPGALAVLVEQVARDLEVLGVDELGIRPAEQSIGLVAEEAAHGLVEEPEAPAAVHDAHEVGSVVDQQAVQRVAGPRRRCRLAVLTGVGLGVHARQELHQGGEGDGG